MLLALNFGDFTFNVGAVDLVCVLGGGGQDSLLVDVKGDNDLSLTLWTLRNVLKLDLTKLGAVGGRFSLSCLTFDNSEVDSWLVGHNRCVFLLSSVWKLGVLGDHDTHSEVVLSDSDLDSEVE